MDTKKKADRCLWVQKELQQELDISRTGLISKTDWEDERGGKVVEEKYMKPSYGGKDQW